MKIALTLVEEAMGFICLCLRGVVHKITLDDLYFILKKTKKKKKQFFKAFSLQNLEWEMKPK